MLLYLIKSSVIFRYVTFGRIFDDGRGIGNQLFVLAAVLYVAELTGRQPVIFNLTYATEIEKMFDLGIPRYDEDVICPCELLAESHSLRYFDELEKLADNHADVPNIWLTGFYQSWKYLRSIGIRMRRHLVLRSQYREFVDRFLANNVPPNWIKSFVRVGIHVRRGDVVDQPEKLKFGYTTPNDTYFRQAMTYFVDKYESRIQFIVASNDITWSKQNLDPIVDELNKSRSISHNITYSEGHSNIEDLALLSSCDHVIMSTGTYGWWAAWLAKGETIYYADWPRNGSTLASMFRKEDFFPPSWIGIT
jgi:galactoside 2-L-fucosyltransferase 1/2